MALKKYTNSESFGVVKPEEVETIQQHVHAAGQKTAANLTEEQRKNLRQELDKQD